MFSTKPTSRFIYFTLILILSISLLPNIAKSNNLDDIDDVDDLIALDNEEEDASHKPSSEAEMLTKAQRIVLELNNDNTNVVVSGNEFVLVLGYAPWDVRSAELMPRFAEAASELRELESKVLMSKVDAERYPKAASGLGIKGYPTLLLFVNGSSQAYTGGFSA
ncbi:PDI-like 1-5 [Artemisia annua]|uniref:PDI-like 1-5 n=1 Tax=Artemisia annua TaxID=35608 RepID=A0A2U1P490_ARTAN|nr:PDI-like 1-5 [Artemisia annua]